MLVFRVSVITHLNGIMKVKVTVNSRKYLTQAIESMHWAWASKKSTVGLRILGKRREGRRRKSRHEHRKYHICEIDSMLTPVNNQFKIYFSDEKSNFFFEWRGLLVRGWNIDYRTRLNASCCRRVKKKKEKRGLVASHPKGRILL